MEIPGIDTLHHGSSGDPVSLTTPAYWALRSLLEDLISVGAECSIRGVSTATDRGDRLYTLSSEAQAILRYLDDLNG